MSFGGGFVSSMISSLKNNSRKRKTIYEKKEMIFDKNTGKTGGLKTKKAKPEQLKNVRTRLKKENRIQTTIGLVIAISVLTFVIYFW